MDNNITFRDVIYEIIKYPLNADPNYNKSLYHEFMGAKILVHIEYLLFTYNHRDFIVQLNSFIKLLLEYPSIIDEFISLIPIIIMAIRFIRTNNITCSEHTDAFELTRKLLYEVPRLNDIINQP